MKKSLIALAVASAAMAGSAYAANVEVYGLLDTSLAYVYADPDASGHDGEGKFTMETPVNSVPASVCAVPKTSATA